MQSEGVKCLHLLVCLGLREFYSYQYRKEVQPAQLFPTIRNYLLMRRLHGEKVGVDGERPELQMSMVRGQ